ncbi:MAG TPA: hypothetical protein VHE53_01145 [Patescibacteria group bacterium]|nr:hypothetical protein [Patescibacteria group bacterium]
MIKKNEILIIYIIYLIICFSIISFTFKDIRNSFPPTPIVANQIVGYSQYFDYPLYFDSLFFLVLILLPVIFFSFAKLFKK